ncbi:hypothetical protein BH23BAC1_BH23BAC1_43480 [soil metagenome]
MKGKFWVLLFILNPMVLAAHSENTTLTYFASGTSFNWQSGLGAPSTVGMSFACGFETPIKNISSSAIPPLCFYCFSTYAVIVQRICLRS